MLNSTMNVLFLPCINKIWYWDKWNKNLLYICRYFWKAMSVWNLWICSLRYYTLKTWIVTFYFVMKVFFLRNWFILLKIVTFDALLLILFIIITLLRYQFNEYKPAKNLVLDTRRLAVSNKYNNRYGSLQWKCHEAVCGFLWNRFPGNVNWPIHHNF